MNTTILKYSFGKILLRICFNYLLFSFYQPGYLVFCIIAIAIWTNKAVRYIWTDRLALNGPVSDTIVSIMSTRPDTALSKSRHHSLIVKHFQSVVNIRQTTGFNKTLTSVQNNEFTRFFQTWLSKVTYLTLCFLFHPLLNSHCPWLLLPRI